MDIFETLSFTQAGPVATVELNRPNQHNALNARMVAELLHCFEALRDDGAYENIRVVVLRGAGDSFCAGSDIGDVSARADVTIAQDRRAAMVHLETLLRTVREAPQVVIARVQGTAMGDGFGLVCVSDIAVAGYSAQFSLPEVRLGLVPSIIAPYVIARLGHTCARYVMLSGVRFNGHRARRLGLVHEHCPDNELDARIGAIIADVLQAGPLAQRACKQLLAYLLAEPETLDYRLDLLDRLQTSEEASEGMRAFLEHRQPPWAADE